VLLFAGSRLASAPAASPDGNVSEEKLYTALLEPNIGADGRISSERQRAILTVAEKILNASQLAELKGRLAAYSANFTVSTAAGAPVHQGEEPPAALPQAAPMLGPVTLSGAPMTDDCNVGCCPPRTHLLDNLSFFAGLDGSKGPEDLGINANMGGRAAVNWGIPVLEDWGLGVQVGTAINYGEDAVAVLKTVDDIRQRTQNFTTVGVFQRTAFGLNWGLGYDYLCEHYYSGLDLTQWRAQVGYAINDNNEFGVWGTKADRGDQATVAGASFHLHAISQANLFWRHIWPNEIVTRVWGGLADEHGTFVLVLPDHNTSHVPFVFGAELYVPLTERLAIFGEANFVTPYDSGTVTATLGIAIYPRPFARQTARSRFAPMLPVANNPTFGVDLEH
jgi:hypothetical protein